MIKDSSFSTISQSTIIGNQLKSTQSEDNLRLPAITGGSHSLTTKTKASVSSGNLSYPSQQKKKKKTIISSSTAEAAASLSSDAAVAASAEDSGCTDRLRNTHTAAVPEDKKPVRV